MNVQKAADGRGPSDAMRTSSAPPEALSELGRATTAYFEASPDRVDQARREYEEAVRKFKAMSGTILG